jgi:hypothetical protein
MTKVRKETILQASSFLIIADDSSLKKSNIGYEVAQSWQYAIDTWNEYMNVYKVCQPCRAYNLNVNFYSKGDDEDGSHSGRPKAILGRK